MATTILRPGLTMRCGMTTLGQHHNVAIGITAAAQTQVNLARSLSSQYSASRRRLSTHDTIKAALPLQLYPHQMEAAASCVEAVQNGRHRIAVSLPTGSGKTVIYTALIPFLKNEGSSGGQVLVVVPNTGMFSSVASGRVTDNRDADLAHQTYNFIRHNLPHFSVGIEQGNSQASGQDDVIVATYQSMRQDSRLQRYGSTQIKGIILDEAHHVAASSYRKILSCLTASSRPMSNVPVIGFSATMGCRADGQALSAILDEIVYHKDVSALIDSGHLTPATYTNVRTGRDFSSLEVSRMTYDFDEESAAAMVNTPAFNSIVVQTYLSQCSKAPGFGLRTFVADQPFTEDRKCTVVYALNYAHTRDLLSAFRQAEVAARSLTGFNTVEERSQTLADFAQGKFSVLIGGLLLIESANMPSVDSILLARPTRSRIAFAQMVGRGALLHPGKADYRIIDFCDNKNHNGGFNNLATISGLQQATYNLPRLQAILQNRDVIHDAANVHDFAYLENVSTVPEAVSVEEASYEDEAAPFHALDGEDPFSRDCPEGRKARRMSRYAWICCNTGRYVLSISKEECISITLTDRTFVIKWEGRVNSYLFFSRKEEIVVGEASDLHAAFEAADLMLEGSMTRFELARLQRFAPWRSRTLATECLDRLKREMSRYGRLQLLKDSMALTVGQVSTILTVLKQTA
ncbi:hypothetical protein QFC21_005085 [Naganishia friedmannii]|uniref:Uncharacterized protein n=1 Tax=Naganishia friedmannii TaxID=89922 RepID=A0ACC2VCC0_9TREE|nr:hypothetical protein QFC21_005085 [Naganishia friedmannii]